MEGSEKMCFVFLELRNNYKKKIYTKKICPESWQSGTGSTEGGYRRDSMDRSGTARPPVGRCPAVRSIVLMYDSSQVPRR